MTWDRSKFDTRAVQQHYGRPTLVEEVLEAVERAGHSLDALFHEDLRTIDAFHIRGSAATRALAELAQLANGAKVLDIGSGIGGTARHLAAEFGADVTGIDLTPEYCELAGELSVRTGLAECTRFVQGSALLLPFEDRCFDVAWTEHVQMNIADKAGFYAEAARVLRPGGRFAFHDIFAGPTGAPVFPVPWAAEPQLSHLASPDSVQSLLEALGLERLEWRDASAEAVEFFEKVLERARREGPPKLGLHQLVGDGAPERFANLLANLEQERVVVVESVWQRSAEAG